MNQKGSCLPPLARVPPLCLPALFHSFGTLGYTTLRFSLLDPPPPLPLYFSALWCGVVWCGVPGGPLPAFLHLPARELHFRAGLPRHLVADLGAGAIPQPAGHAPPPDRPHHRGQQEVHRHLLVPGLIWFDLVWLVFFVLGLVVAVCLLSRFFSSSTCLPVFFCFFFVSCFPSVVWWKSRCSFIYFARFSIFLCVEGIGVCFISPPSCSCFCRQTVDFVCPAQIAGHLFVYTFLRIRCT